MLNSITLNNIYKNKKNKKYYIVKDLVTHSETLEPMVLYHAVNGSDDTKWVRPFNLFLEKFQEVEGG